MEGYSEEEGELEGLDLWSKEKDTQLCRGDQAGIMHTEGHYSSGYPSFKKWFLLFQICRSIYGSSSHNW